MENDKDPLTPARDGFERYYTEKLWDWIPPVYRDEDALAPSPDVLRAIVEVLARQAAIARRSIDRLWDDQFIELCDDWAIPYIGDLVGTRLVHELNRRGRRVDVAKTIFYRRRKGTPLVLEVLARDIAGWEGALVESFRRLARTRHGFDPEPMGLEGQLTETPPGGWARLTLARGAELVDGPFGEYAHTPDFRRLRGRLGRYNIPKLNFHLFRLLPFKVRFATPADFDEGTSKSRFTFDPSGRDIPLFSPDQRRDRQPCHPPREWELPAAIACRLLNEVRYTITEGLIHTLVDEGLSLPAADELARYVGVPFRNEARLRETLASLGASAEVLAVFEQVLAGAITEDSPKVQLVPDAVAVALGADNKAPAIGHPRIAAGNLEDWGASLGMLFPEKTLVIDPERGRFWLPDPLAGNVWIPIYHYGFSGSTGAGTHDRRDGIATENVTPIPNGGDGNPGPVTMNVPPAPLAGVFQFDDSKTYLPDGDITGIEELTLQAANFQRPYVKRKVAAGTEWVFEAAPKIQAEARSLTLEGLWVGIEEAGAAPVPAPCPPVPTALVLQGNFDHVLIRHCTLDPGGEKARIDFGQCQAIPYVRLLVRGNVEELEIELSIVGAIVEDGTSGAIQRLVVRDSIVQGIDPAAPAIETTLGQVDLRRVTVFGDVRVNRLFASEALVQGVVRVTDNQRGCFRFSAANEDPATRLPQQFQSHLFAPALPNHFFVSRRFGDPGYAQLSETAPQAIVRGAENRSEIGAFSALIQSVKRDDLEAKVSEFMPFGLIAQFINET